MHMVHAESSNTTETNLVTCFINLKQAMYGQMNEKIAINAENDME